MSRVIIPEYIPPPPGKKGGEPARPSQATASPSARVPPPPALYNDASAPPPKAPCTRCGRGPGVVGVIHSYRRSYREPTRHEHGRICLPCVAELGGAAAARALGGPWAGDVAELVAAVGRSLFESDASYRRARKAVKPVMSSRDTSSAVRRGGSPKKGRR
jgi:hypothetical protein